MRLLSALSTRGLAALAAALVVVSVSVSAGGAAPQSKKKGAGPETFNGKAKIGTATATADAAFTIQIDQYTPDKDLKAMEQALQSGGSDGFVQALKKAPVAGHLKVGDKSFTIRWAKQVTTPKGRSISLVTDGPVFFVGAGAPDAKPRAGYDVAVAKMDIDTAGLGEGLIALAAKVKPGGQTGVEIQDYAAEPVKLVSIMRVIS
jgi:hypothetical protein